MSIYSQIEREIEYECMEAKMPIFKMPKAIRKMPKAIRNVNVLLTLEVIESWEGVWGKPIPSDEDPSRGVFDNARVEWHLIDGIYHIFIDDFAAYETGEGGNPRWITLSEHENYLFSQNLKHSPMIEPDMDLDEIHAAQELMSQ